MAAASPPEGSRDWATRAVLAVTVGGAFLLVPWILVLSTELPDTPPGGAWRLAWVGYDAGLAVSLAATGWFVWRRHRLAHVALVISAVLVLTDAWFDFCLSWGTAGQDAAVVSAVLIELPAAALLAWAAARRVPPGPGVGSHRDEEAAHR